MDQTEESPSLNEEFEIPTASELQSFIEEFYENYKKNKTIESHEIVETEEEGDVDELMPQAEKRKSSKLVREAWLGEKQDSEDDEDDDQIRRIVLNRRKSSSSRMRNSRSSIPMGNHIQSNENKERSNHCVITEQASSKRRIVDDSDDEQMSDEDFYEEDSSSEDDHEDSDDKAEGFVKTYNFLKTFEQRHKNSTGQKEYLEENDVLIGPDHHSKENTSFENRLERKSCEIENDKSDHENSDQKHLISDQQTAENHIITEKKKKVHCIEIIDSDDECDQEEISLDHTNVEQSDKKEKLVCEAERNQVELSENSINQDSSKELLSDKICNEKDQESTSNDICGSDVAIQSLKDQDLNVAKMKDHYLLMKYYEKKMNEEKELLEKIQLEKEQLGENDCLEDELSHSDVVEAKIQELKQQGKLESEEQFLRKRALKRKVADSGLDAFSKEKLNHKDKEITQYIPKEHGNKGYENMSDEYGKQNLRLDKERNRQTLMDVGLANEKKQNIAEHFLHQRKYAQSTLHKHAWVLRLYDYFAEDMDFKPFPMSLECVRGFIRFLAYDCRYCVYSIYAVVLPSLKRIQVKMYNKPIDVQLNTELNLIVNEMRRDKSLKQKGEGKEPLMTFDVKYLVQSIPDFFMSKAEECSLFLFALHTGARAITCGNVRLCDVRQVIIEDDSIFLKIRLMRNKGNDKWNHIVLLENQTEENKSLDAVYWMRQHILQKFGKDLFLKEEWPLKEKSEELIWSWSSETMRTRLKKRLELAGFPPENFGFHSFRSGFLCSALMNAGSNKEKRNSILETCAFIAGWIPYSRSQMVYVKKSASQNFIASRVIMTSSDKRKKSFVEKKLLRTESFHGFKLQSNKWNDDIIFVNFYHQILKKLKKERDGKRNSTDTCRYLFHRALSQYSEEEPDLEEKAKLKYLPLLKKSKSSSHFQIKSNMRSEIARKDLLFILKLDQSKLNEMVEMFWSFMKERNIVEKEVKTRNNNRKNESETKMKLEKREKDKNGKRKRRIWSKEEDDVLKEHKNKGEKWIEISKFLENRTAGDCYDRWRNIKNKEKKENLS